MHKDTLQDAINAQLELQQKSYKLDPKEMNQEDKLDFIRWNVLALEDELHEALAETGWKPWAKSKHINRNAFVSELVDAFHFFINLTLVVDCDAEELLARYFEKRNLNADRQKRGYDGVNGKCSICKRAIDDPAVKCTVSQCYETSDHG